MEILITQSNQIPEGKAKSFLLEDGREIALFKVKGKVFALDNSCPHMGGPLGEGDLEDCYITCPWHGYQFDVTNGACINVPGYDATSFKVIEREGAVYLVE